MTEQPDGDGRAVDAAPADRDGPVGSGPDEAADADEPSPPEDEYEPSLAGVFGAESEDAPPRPEIVPESVSLENALFVLLGVLLGVFVVYRAATVFGG